jgi:pimeloyl-ACP methyl ester carboxylesterase
VPARIQRLAALLPLLAASTWAELAFEPCTLTGSSGYGRVQAQCAKLMVAEDPAHAGEPTLALQVARIPSLAPEPAADPFTVINGGPGASSIDLYVDLEPAFAAIRRQRDIVLLDQRGTGQSGRLDCPSLQSATETFDADSIRSATAACLAELTIDPRFYTTSVAVLDLESLRRSLGIARWNLYGVSYGTRVAQHYARRFPDAVRTLTLDGVIPPALALGPDVAINAEDTLQSIVARCAADTACAAAFPSLADDLRELRQTLTDKPVSITLTHPVSGRPQTMLLQYAHLAMTLRLLSYAPETAALIPLLLHEAAVRDNFLPVAAQALRIEQSLSQAISFGMHNSVVCTEDVPFFGDVADLLPRLDATYLGGDQVRALALICRQWPAGPLDPEFREPLRSTHPTLVLSGELDPITPPSYGDLVAATQSHARHLIAPGQGHGVIARGCLPEIVDDFVAAGTVDDLDAECVERLAPDPFFVDLLGPPP